MGEKSDGSFEHGPFSCPWPAMNTAFRAALSSVGVALTLAATFFYYKDALQSLQWISYLYAVTSACWLSLASLDANALRVGNELCENNFRVDVAGESYHLLSGLRSSEMVCLPSPFIWLTVGGFASWVILAAASLIWWKYSRVADPSSRTSAALVDPFLATVSGSYGLPGDDDDPDITMA